MMTQEIRKPTKRPRLANVRSTGLRAVVVGLVWLSSIAHAVELESFTQAHRSVDVPSVDMGVLAEVVVEEVEGNPGYYTSKFFLKPHYQLEGLSVSLRLVSKLPSAKG